MLVPEEVSSFSGVKLVRWEGRDWNLCIAGTVELAAQKKWPLSVESKNFSKWQQFVNWSNVIRGERKRYKNHFSIGISALVTNYFN